MKKILKGTNIQLIMLVWMVIISYNYSSASNQELSDSTILIRYKDSLEKIENSENKINLHKSFLNKFNDSKYKLIVLYNLSKDFNKTGKFLRSSKYINTALNNTDFSGKNKIYAELLNLKGKNYREVGNYPHSIESYLKALEIYDSLNLKREQARCLKDIGLLYWDLKDINKAKEYYKKALKISRRIDDKKNMAYVYNNLAMIYYEENHPDEALNLFRKSLKIKHSLNDETGYANTLNNIGFVYQYYGKPDSSLYYYKKANEIYESQNDSSALANTYNNMAKSYIKQDKYKTALKYLEKTYKIGKARNLQNVLKENYLHRYRIYLEQKKHVKALEYYRRYSELNTHILNKKLKGQINELEKRYELDRQDREIELLKKQKKIKSIELQKQKRLKNILIICIIIIIAMTILALRNRFNKVKKNRLLHEQNKKISEKNTQLKKAHNDLQKKTQELEQNRNKIEKQKDKLEEQFNIIQSKSWELSNSFQYAGHIQAAILPDREQLKENFEDYFVLLRPKEIVSGDFYWFTEVNNKILVAVADCTGHGVAGGLLSMLGISYLNEIVNARQITSPEKILDELRKMLIKSLKQKETTKSYLSGIDMAMISINKEKDTIEFAGANNPLYVIRENELHEFIADKMPIAYYDKMPNFSKQIITAKKGDQLYLFSDGFTDQFGGHNQKKFKFKPFRKLIVENNRKSMEEQKNLLNKTFETWKGDLEQVDDVLVMGIRL